MRALVLTTILVVSTGCRTLDRFDTKDGEAYCGSMVTSGFVRNGFKPNELRLRVRIDADHLDSAPGTLTTNDDDPTSATGVEDAVVGDCAPVPLFSETPMVVTDALLNDQLSTFDFGTGRDHNFFAWAQSSCKGQVLVVVSLMKNDDVEVRLMRPPDPPVGDVVPKPDFALFPLSRQRDDCLE